MKKGEIRARRISSDLTSGRGVSDEKFDLLIPLSARNYSTIHWTPVSVAIHAMKALERHSGPSANEKRRFRILDVGSGCGKFCLVACHFSEARFTGIEQRGPLVEAANAVADAMNLQNVEFHQGDACALDWNHYDVLYFFNPFYEHILPAIQMTDAANYSEEKYRTFVAQVEKKLAELPSGKFVLTYNGFGGEFPEGFSQLESEFVGAAYVELWVKE